MGSGSSVNAECCVKGCDFGHKGSKTDQDQDYKYMGIVEKQPKIAQAKQCAHDQELSQTDSVEGEISKKVSRIIKNVPHSSNESSQSDGRGEDDRGGVNCSIKVVREYSDSTPGIREIKEDTKVTSSDPLEALEIRQDAIFTKLQDLRATLNKLTSQYQTSEPPKATSTKPKSTQSRVAPPVTMVTTASTQGVVDSPLGNGIHDIVISADPDQPPLSLFVLYELLKQQFKVLATSYMHSSVVNVDQRLCDVIKNGCQVTRGEHQIALSVVWKKVKDGPHLMISPTKQSVISGEVNVARYINRLLSPGFDSEDIVKATLIDEWLDVADNQLIHGNSKQRTAAVKNLNSRLKRNDWVFGESFSLVDIVMWSTLHQSHQADSAPENIKKWMEACEALPMFKEALTFVSS